MKNAKGTLALLLALILALPLCLSGCGKKDTGPLRICVDLGYNADLSAIFENMLGTVADYDGPEDVEVEYIPADGADRESMIKHLKTELMSGSGPDLFLVDTYIKNDVPMFPIPEQMLERRVFLPLDEYIENAQFAQWDRMTSIVMEAGRGSEGQMLVPMSYTVPLTCYRAGDYQHIISAGLTWQDMMNDDSGMFRQCGYFFRPGTRDCYTSSVFTRLADYGEEELLFTQDELFSLLEQKLRLEGEFNAGAWDGLPKCYQRPMSLDFSPIRFEVGYTSSETLSGGTPMIMVPMYNQDGGVTAKIANFAAINRNSKRPGDAFFVLDFLMGREAMRYSEVYKYITYYDLLSIPMDEDMGTGELSFQHNAPLAPENLDQFRQVRDSITYAGFSNILDKYFDRLLIDSLTILYEDGGDAVEDWSDVPTIDTCSPEAREKIEGLVAESYRLMQAELEES